MAVSNKLFSSQVVYSQELFMEVCRPVLQILNLFQGGKNEHALFHTGFQSWPRKSTPVFRLGLKDLCIVCQLNRELEQRRRRRQQERQKSNRVLSPKQQLCTSQAFLYISLPSLHDYHVKLPNFMFRGGRERTKTIFFFFFKNQMPQESSNI